MRTAIFFLAFILVICVSGKGWGQGPEAYFRFDETALDSSGNANHGTVQGGVTWTEDPLGKPNGAILFDGVAGYLEMPDLGLSGAISITAWVRFDTVTFFGRILDFGSGEVTDNIILGRQATSDHLWFEIWSDGDTSGTCVALGAITTAEWMYISAVWTDGAQMIYVNGQLVESCTISGAVRSVARQDNWLARSAWLADGFFGGAMDEVRIYDRALSDQEVRDLFLSFQEMARVERTGQTSCWDAGGSSEPCAGTGQDADHVLQGHPLPEPRFVFNGDGTSTDLLTGLIWLTDADCTGVLPWQSALEWANRLSDGCTDCGGSNNDCGLSDGSVSGAWHLPNVNELNSLIHFDYVLPAISNSSGSGHATDGDPFLNVGPYYFTSTTNSSNPSEAFRIDTQNGTGIGEDKSNTIGVWAAREGPTAQSKAASVEMTGQETCWDELGNPIVCLGTGQDGDLRAGTPWPNPRYKELANGTVRDQLTGAIWLQDAYCAGLLTWQEGLDWAARLADGCDDCGGSDNDCGLSDGSRAGDWRLPNVKEYQSLLDLEYASPSLCNAAGDGQWIEGDPFDNVQSEYYFSSTSFIEIPSASLGGNLDLGGFTDIHFKDGALPAWALLNQILFADGFESGDISAWSGLNP